MRLLPILTFAAVVLLALIPAGAQPRPTRGILGRVAPAWDVAQWINLPDGTKSLDVADLRGKVVYLYCFQSWCPGCHSSGFPTLQEMIRRFRGKDDVAFVAVQTVFEGYSTNTREAARETAKRYDLDIPVGHDGAEGKRSALMQRYRTGGTPWTIIIDKAGTVRFNDFHAKADAASRLIDELRTKPAAPKAAPSNEKQTVPTLPKKRGGQDLVGKPWPKLAFDRWIRKPVSSATKDGQVEPTGPTLYRWWTDTCPYCRASLPGIEKLRKKYRDRGLNVVAVYHPKPPREVDDEAILEYARSLGYDGAIALDQDWSELRRAYLDTHRRAATSVSMLVDAQGIVRFVHPGPVLFPSDDPKHARENADYDLLERAIQALIRPAHRRASPAPVGRAPPANRRAGTARQP